MLPPSPGPGLLRWSLGEVAWVGMASCSPWTFLCELILGEVSSGDQTCQCPSPLWGLTQTQPHPDARSILTSLPPHAAPTGLAYFYLHHFPNKDQVSKPAGSSPVSWSG